MVEIRLGKWHHATNTQQRTNNRKHVGVAKTQYILNSSRGALNSGWGKSVI